MCAWTQSGETAAYTTLSSTLTVCFINLRNEPVVTVVFNTIIPRTPEENKVEFNYARGFDVSITGSLAESRLTLFCTLIFYISIKLKPKFVSNIKTREN